MLPLLQLDYHRSYSMLEIIMMIETWWFVATAAVGGWLLYLINNFKRDIMDELTEIKQETIDNRNRSIAAQEVVKECTTAINELKLVLVEMKVMMRQLSNRTE